MPPVRRIDGAECREPSDASSFDFSWSDLQPPLQLDLRAEELRALSERPASPPPRMQGEPVVRMPVPDQVTLQARVQSALASRNIRFSAPSSALAASAAAAAVITGFVAYVSATSTTSQLDAAVVLADVSTPFEEAPAVQVSEARPVRVSNPFDASEVFEFPPGTSADEAQDAVAELLLKRALGRIDESGRTARTRQPEAADGARRQMHL